MLACTENKYLLRISSHGIIHADDKYLNIQS